MVEIREFSPGDERFLTITARDDALDADVSQKVAEILRNVRERGSDALLEYVRKFDGPVADAQALRVTDDELARAAAETPPEFHEAIRLAAQNIERFHEKQIRHGYTISDNDGVSLSKRVLPISRVGVYCPAGTAPLFSSLLMNAIPAQLAGVREIAVAIPPGKDGEINSYMLATARQLGLNEVYKMGGAHAVGAFAYGADPVRKVDKIVGPGNAYVVTAKRQVFGSVGIDSLAGPSEIVIIADAGANARYIAADLLSQMEHGSGREAGVLLTDDRRLAEQVRDEVEAMLQTLERSDAIHQALARYGAIFVCRDLDEAVDASNVIAPEHLEIQTAQPRRLLASVLNAGAVFLGPWSSEPVGDYFAGTNHVLPTNGAARFSSSLGVADFQKDMSVIDYSAQRLREFGDKIVLMAEKEELTAHANAVKVRLDDLR